MLVTDPHSPTSAVVQRQRYLVRMPEPANHLFEIELELTEVDLGQPLQLKFPVWTPGSYLVREYARHVQDLRIIDDQGQLLGWRKLNKSTWQIQPNPDQIQATRIYVQYHLYAYELTVRTNHLDLTHGYLNGAASFFYVPGRVSEPWIVTLQLPEPHWQIATSLDRIVGSPTDREQTFLANSFDELVDSPIEAGIHQRGEFQVLDKPHTFVVWGQGNLDLEQTIADTQKIVATTAQLFGDLPYGDYLFLLHLSAGGFGGLEHKNSTSLNFSRFEFHQPERYQRFLSLVAHEFFHTWNVKRLRPKALESFNYDQETYLSCLWFCEGATSYYELLILLRSGLITPHRCLTILSERITRLQKIPGRHVQSLAESSFDTWIKLYRPHENTSNSQISYYLKGALVCWLLDLQIRICTEGSRSMDVVMQDLWQQFGRWERGYTDQELQQTFEQAAGQPLGDWFDRYIYSTEELDYNKLLYPFGLQLQIISPVQPVPHLGICFGGNNRITTVEIDSPAQRAGIWAGDELLALDGFKVDPQSLTERLKAYAPGQVVEITVFHAEELQTVRVILAPPLPEAYQIGALPEISDDQRALCQGWLGVGDPWATS